MQQQSRSQVLLDGDADAGFHASGGVLDSECHHTRSFAGLADDYQLAVEEAHLRLGEGLQRSGIAVAGSLVGARSSYAEFKPVGSIGALGAILVHEAHGDIGKVVAIGGDGLALRLQHEAFGLACSADNLLPCLVAVFVIDNNF